MHNFNTYLFTAINQGATLYKPLDIFFIVATSYFFSYIVFFTVGCYLLVYLPHKAENPLIRLRRFLQGFQVAVSVFITWYIVKILKMVLAVSRPYTVLNDANLLVSNSTATESFPSGHAALLMALATGVYFYHKKLGYILFLLTGIVGLSRIYVGVHYPLDVFGGAVIGYIIPFIFYRVFAKQVKTS